MKATTANATDRLQQPTEEAKETEARGTVSSTRLVDVLQCLRLLQECPPTVLQISEAGDRAVNAARISPMALEEGLENADKRYLPPMLEDCIQAIETAISSDNFLAGTKHSYIQNLKDLAFTGPHSNDLELTDSIFELGSITIPFGKHKGKDFNQTPLRYLDHTLSTITPRTWIVRKAEEYIDRAMPLVESWLFSIDGETTLSDVPTDSFNSIYKRFLMDRFLSTVTLIGLRPSKLEFYFGHDLSFGYDDVDINFEYKIAGHPND